MSYITALVISTTTSELQVNTDDITFLSDAGASYEYVRIDEYQTSQLPTKGPFPPPEQSQGSASSPLSAMGVTTLFKNLKPNTSYTFLLWGVASIDGYGGNYPVYIDRSVPVTTPAQAAGSSSAPDYPAPVCTGAAFPQTLQDSNRIVINWTSPTHYDVYGVTCDYSANPPVGSRVDDNNGGTSGSYTFGQLRPGSVHSFSVQGGADYVGGILAGGLGHHWSAYSPLIYVQAVQNTRGLRKFLQDSGVSGTNGIRPLVPKTSAISLRNLLGV
jgi:hypothetical protein